MLKDAGGTPRTDATPRGAGRDDAPVLLIAEDDPATLGLLRDLAVDAGWEARGFRRLAPCRAEIERSAPDLVILDDDLPDGSGGDLARELRADRRTRNVGVLVCTAAHPMRRAEITQWAPVVAKPFDLRQIEAFLQIAGRRRRPAAG